MSENDAYMMRNDGTSGRDVGIRGGGVRWAPLWASLNGGGSGTPRLLGSGHLAWRHNARDLSPAAHISALSSLGSSGGER